MTTEQAFNLGSDARLRGESLDWNPYVSSGLRWYWQLGWNDVNNHWGKSARPRRWIKPLPPVVEATLVASL